MAGIIRDPRHVELLMKKYVIRLGVSLGLLEIALHVDAIARAAAWWMG